MACKDPLGVLSDVSMGSVCIGNAFVSDLAVGGLPTVQPAVLAGFGPSQVFGGPIVCSGGIAGGLTITTPAASLTTIESGEQGFDQVYTDALVVAKTSAYGVGQNEVASLQVRMYNDGDYLNGFQTGLLVETHRNGAGLFLKANGPGNTPIALQQNGPTAITLGNGLSGSSLVLKDPVATFGVTLPVDTTVKDYALIGEGLTYPSKTDSQFYNSANPLSRFYGVPIPKTGPTATVTDNQGNINQTVNTLQLFEGSTSFSEAAIGDCYVVVPPGTRSFEFEGWTAPGGTTPAEQFIFSVIWGEIISNDGTDGFLVRLNSLPQSGLNPKGCFPAGSALFAFPQGGNSGCSLAILNGWSVPSADVPKYLTVMFEQINALSPVAVRIF
jgi:hypothetical protein